VRRILCIDWFRAHPQVIGKGKQKLHPGGDDTDGRGSNGDVRLGAKTVYQALDEFVKRASEAYGDRIHGITLFGSVARGTARPDSDIDLLVVVDKEDFRLRRELIGMAFDMQLETGEDISVKVLSQKDFEARKGFSFLRNVISEGVKIA
jgi:predicted nucleotidyltransferase